VKPGHRILVHAAAGGTGQLVCQMAKLLGAEQIIGTVSSEEKATVAKQVSGCTDVIVYKDAKAEKLAQQVRKLAKDGVHVCYDGVGKDTWEESLDSLAVRGMMVSFGNASGAVPAFSPLELSKRGSLSLCRPSLAHYVRNRDELNGRAKQVFEWVRKNQIKVNIHKTFELKDAAAAHLEIEGRKTLGKILISTLKKL